MSVQVEDSMDVMIIHDTTRHVTSLLGFPPIARAQLAGAASALSELVLKTGELHTVHITGIEHHNRIGAQLSTEAKWLAGQPVKNIVAGLRSKLGNLIDEVIIDEDAGPAIIIILWNPDN